MKRLTISLFTFVLLMLVSCNNLKESSIELQILSHKYYDNMSSASGVTLIDNKIAFVGDDIPWLVELNDDLTIGELIKLSGIDSIVDGRTPSRIKADYECMETFTDAGLFKTLVLSSGSKLNSRDTAVLISFGDSIHILKKNIRPLYEKIKLQADMGDEEINIEGLALAEQNAYLFHRGNISGNFITEINRKQLLDYLESGEHVPDDIIIYPFQLPLFDGVASGFSGAYYYADQELLLFTASMEATSSVTADGKVSGSYIGYIPIDSLSKGTFYSTLLKKDGKILAKKLEGICVKTAYGNVLDILSVCDNDDGSSDLYLIKMNINK